MKYFKIGFKKVTMVLLVVCMLGVTACGGENQTSVDNTEATMKEKQTINVAVMKGPTAIGMVKLMDEDKNNNTTNDYNFTVAAAADEFTASLIKGDIQIAALPCNAAATLYNKSEGKIKILAINTLGVLYILDNDKSVNSVSDLKGRTIYSTGKGTTPEYTLRYLLKQAGLNPDKDVTIEFKQEAAEVAAIMATDKSAVAMLPQPYVTTVLQNNSNARIAIDVTKAWEGSVKDNSTVVTGVIAVNAQFYENNKEAVKNFAKEYKSSVDYVSENVDKTAELVEQEGIFKAQIAKLAIPYCNIVYIDGDDMKSKVNSYLKVLYDENPLAVGGAMPTDEFYINMK